MSGQQRPSVCSSVFGRFGFARDSHWLTWCSIARGSQITRVGCVWTQLRNETECVWLSLCLRIRSHHSAIFSFRPILGPSVIRGCRVSLTAVNRKQLMHIAVYHFLIHPMHETRNMRENIFIRLIFTISDSLCCCGVSYLLLAPPCSACWVNNASGDADTCLKPPPSRLITCSLLFSSIRFSASSHISNQTGTFYPSLCFLSVSTSLQTHTAFLT